MTIYKEQTCLPATSIVYYTDEDLITQDNAIYSVATASFGTRTLTIHDNPSPNAILTFIDNEYNFGNAPLVILPGAGQTIARKASMALSNNGATVSLIYQNSVSDWNILNDGRG